MWALSTEHMCAFVILFNILFNNDEYVFTNL